MGDNSQKGLGSDNMDPQTKHDIQSEGGQSSHSGGRNSDTGMKGGQSSQVGQTGQQSGSQGRDEQGQFTEGSDEASEAGQRGGSM